MFIRIKNGGFTGDVDNLLIDFSGMPSEPQHVWCVIPPEVLKQFGLTEASNGVFKEEKMKDEMTITPDTIVFKVYEIAPYGKVNAFTDNQ